MEQLTLGFEGEFVERCEERWRDGQKKETRGREKSDILYGHLGKPVGIREQLYFAARKAIFSLNFTGTHILYVNKSAVRVITNTAQGGDHRQNGLSIRAKKSTLIQPQPTSLLSRQQHQRQDGETEVRGIGKG